jgi:protease I
MAEILLVIAPERFRDEELFITREVLESAGHHITIASLKRGECPGSRGGTATAEFALDEIQTARYAAVVFVGGGGSKLLFNHPEALRIAREAHAAGKVSAAICLAPVILANAGVLKGKKATVAGTEAKTIEAGGATYKGPGVTVDGNVITGNAPKSSRLFGQAIADKLNTRKD